ncbi:DUF397 domain-containing protein [Micromonospora chersina]|uniref:DUF397 domain-containing protein n=1 Tax=Micromonospora chersina TaxID=47854 RepID=UPI00371BF8C9
MAERHPDIVAVRDSKDRTGAALIFAPQAWMIFLSATRSAGITPDRDGTGLRLS